MLDKPIFTNRRQGCSRRESHDPCHGMPLDLFHRKRRRNSERRQQKRNLYEDYCAYMEIRVQRREFLASGKH